MGSSTYADIVPFVARNFWSGVLDDASPEVLLLISGDDFWEDFPEAEEVATFNGWTCDLSDPEVLSIGKHKRLTPENTLTKGDLRVYTLNESPYANGGAFDLAIIANDRLSLEEFLKDWGHLSSRSTIVIREDDTAQQTL